MKITKLSLYAVEFPNKGGAFRRGSGVTVRANVSSIIKLETDEGVVGSPIFSTG